MCEGMNKGAPQSVSKTLQNNKPMLSKPKARLLFRDLFHDSHYPPYVSLYDERDRLCHPSPLCGLCPRA